MNKYVVKYCIALCALLFSASINAQVKKYNPGDTVKEVFELYDINGKVVNIPTATSNYLIFYRYSWRKNAAWGLETADSIKLMEAKIDTILSAGEMHKVRLIVLSYDDKEYFEGWKNAVAAKPFKENPKYTIEYYNTSGNAAQQQKCALILSKVAVFMEHGRLMKWAGAISRFKFSLYGKGGFKGATVKAKLLTNNKGVQDPVENASVLLSTRFKNDTLSKATTDKYGDFQLYVPGNVKDYTIKVKPANPVDNLLLVTQSGQEIANFEHVQGGNFEYRLLKADIVTLSEVQTEDIKMKYDAFHLSNEKELRTDEKIFYESGKSDIKEESKVILGHIAKILLDNPGVTLEIISHTDAIGDDKSNLALSKKRAQAVADYLASHGIDKKRIKTDGEGEKKIRNRCKNGVDCSDKEHEYNRRTEFKFIKP